MKSFGSKDEVSRYRQAGVEEVLGQHGGPLDDLSAGQLSDVFRVWGRSLVIGYKVSRQADSVMNTPALLVWHPTQSAYPSDSAYARSA